MALEALDRLGSKAARILMYPFEWSLDSNQTTRPNQLLRIAETLYKATLIPVQVQRVDTGDRTWAESFTKLLAFNQTRFRRVLSFDSDSTLLQHMYELFLLPRCPVALPRAYWINPKEHILSSQVMLIEPSEFEFDRVLQAIKDKGEDDFDMEIVNKLYQDNAMILPHRPYNLLTGEFRAEDHSHYLGNELEEWHPDAALSEAKLLHFSDWPIPKPWISTPEHLREEKPPKCQLHQTTGVENCRSRDIWLGLYSDFRERRQTICGLLPLPPPDPLRKRHRTKRVEPAAHQPVFLIGSPLMRTATI
ncbi:N-acetylglucosaminyltransferase [Acarospora aff. strigata]|nr:N-acetylglucosaminyltransferase [Acarospora aff. strigata]